LAIFSVGLVIYFGAKTGLKLLEIYWGTAYWKIFDACASVVVILCFLYWIVFINAKVQVAEVRIGHGWRPDEQEKLMVQLEALNGALMRNARQLRSTSELPL
jgi:hypothetical protein